MANPTIWKIELRPPASDTEFQLTATSAVKVEAPVPVTVPGQASKEAAE